MFSSLPSVSDKFPILKGVAGNCGHDGFHSLTGVYTPVWGRAEIRFSVMQDEREIWMLAELAANEKDLEKLAALVKEIDRLLGEKQDRLNRARIPSKPSE